MPSIEKISFFLASAFLSGAAVAILGYGMSQAWMQSFMKCDSLGNSTESSRTITMGLFNGTQDVQICPWPSLEKPVPVFATMKKIDNGAVIVQGIVVGFLVLALLGSAGSITVSLYNTFSNPYQTYFGPIGLFVCSGLSASLAFLAVMLYLVNAFGLDVGSKIALTDTGVNIIGENVTMLVGFYLVLPYIGLSLISISLVYAYTHLSYKQRREKERPTEDAPKDILMF